MKKNLLYILFVFLFTIVVCFLCCAKKNTNSIKYENVQEVADKNISKIDFAANIDDENVDGSSSSIKIVTEDYINELDRLLCELENSYLEINDNVLFEDINTFLINNEKSKSININEHQVIELLRNGFDLNGLKEKILVHCALAYDKNEDGLSIDALKLISPMNSQDYIFRLRDIVRHKEQVFEEIGIESAGYFLRSEFLGYEYSNSHPVVILCYLYPGFLPQNGSNSVNVVNKFGETNALNFITNIVPDDMDSYIIRLTLNYKEKTFTYEYTISNTSVELNTEYQSYESVILNLVQ